VRNTKGNRSKAERNRHAPQCVRVLGPFTFCRNSLVVNEVAADQECRLHTLLTSDPDLAFIVGLWDRLADECKARLIEVIREHLPTESTERTTTSER
jgi:hypothetical protein